MSNEIVLGCKAKDKISGMIGWVTCAITMYNGTVQYGLQPEITSDKLTEHPKSMTFDACQLEFIDDGKIPAPLHPPCDMRIGDKVTDKISNESGIIVEKVLFLNGCLYFQVELPKRNNDGKRITDFVPFQRLQLIQEKVAERTAPATRGGPTRSAPTQRG